MNEKRAREQRKNKKGIPMATIQINLFHGGLIEVDGPMKDPLLFWGMMVDAQKAFLNSMTEAISAEKDKRIVIAQPNVNPLKH